MREVKSTNRSLNEDNQIQMREIEKLRADGKIIVLTFMFYFHRKNLENKPLNILKWS